MHAVADGQQGAIGAQATQEAIATVRVLRGVRSTGLNPEERLLEVSWPTGRKMFIANDGGVNFVANLANEHDVDVSAIQPAKTVARLKAVLASRAGSIGNTESAFIDALVSYSGAVADLAQRQEHGSQREGSALVWEDARRLVFQTMVLMYEVARTLG